MKKLKPDEIKKFLESEGLPLTSGNRFVKAVLIELLERIEKLEQQYENDNPTEPK